MASRVVNAPLVRYCRSNPTSIPISERLIVQLKYAKIVQLVELLDLTGEGLWFNSTF